MLSTERKDPGRRAEGRKQAGCEVRFIHSPVFESAKAQPFTKSIPQQAEYQAQNHRQHAEYYPDVEPPLLDGAEDVEDVRRESREASAEPRHRGQRERLPEARRRRVVPEDSGEDAYQETRRHIDHHIGETYPVAPGVP